MWLCGAAAHIHYRIECYKATMIQEEERKEVWQSTVMLTYVYVLSSLWYNVMASCRSLVQLTSYNSFPPRSG